MEPIKGFLGDTRIKTTAISGHSANFVSLVGFGCREAREIVLGGA